MYTKKYGQRVSAREWSVLYEKNPNTGCSCCGSLAERMKEANGGSYRQYHQILSELTALERQGKMELFAGDCPLEDTGEVLNAEQHYTVCHYLRCRSCGALYFAGACVRGRPVFRRVERLSEENLNVRLWGRCGRWFSSLT